MNTLIVTCANCPRETSILLSPSPTLVKEVPKPLHPLGHIEEVYLAPTGFMMLCPECIKRLENVATQSRESQMVLEQKVLALTRLAISLGVEPKKLEVVLMECNHG